MNNNNFKKAVASLLIAMGTEKCLRFVNTLKERYCGTVDVQAEDDKIAITLDGNKLLRSFPTIYYDLDKDKALVLCLNGEYREITLSEILK